MMEIALVLGTGALIALGLAYTGRVFFGWLVMAATGLATWRLMGEPSGAVFWGVAGVAVVLSLLFGFPALRSVVLSSGIMKMVAPLFPRMGETERIALEAGTVWWDGDLFSGDPDWNKLLAFKQWTLTADEQAFLDGPVEELCQMTDDWEISQQRDLSPEVWAFMKTNKFFGMIVPKEYGGLGFSASAHSAVVTKVASRSVTTAVTIMVPNSLGPAELLVHYGTDEQKTRYLSNLASGHDIPCFALTEPGAGSDAANPQSTGVVTKGIFDGREVLGLRLNWRKRYITLAPVATVVGLAFRCLDPDGLLGGDEDRGITCALLPNDLPGMTIGDRHDPMGVPFQNGPIFGEDVFVPLDFVIGGQDGIGNGWTMLMEQLAAGRSISLPSLSAGAVQLATRVTGAYGTVREQFSTAIGRFEGIEEPLARIGGYTYFMNAARTLTASAVDAGERPAVLSGVVKAYLTEGMRLVVNDAFDIRAGAAICRGPKNILGRGFIGVPIAITVEGANILTRSLIIYGQGAIRSHPFIQDEMAAIADQDVARFDKAFFGHAAFMVKNIVRSLMLALTGGALASSPVTGPEGRYYKKLSRYSASFALVSDAALAVLGGNLKRREKISGRLADALAWLYLGSAALKRFYDDGRPARDLPLVVWSCDLALHNIEKALDGVIDNFPNRVVAWFLRRLVFPFGTGAKLPSDELGAKIANGLLDSNEMRLALTADIFIPDEQEAGLGRLEAALTDVVQAQPAKRKLNAAVRSGKIQTKPQDSLYARAFQAGIIDADESEALLQADVIRDEVIQVDYFGPGDYANLKG
ncbi:MAG: acyl-CoA dehydrogenase [Alphaproteobacteria bacterium]|nr:acyl-CoA dehydrogenase [Alphaproteobacteria bacterium]